jgi:hypothetical protein
MESLESKTVNGTSSQTYAEADKHFRKRHFGPGLVIANGPSLKDVSNQFLRKYPSIGCNRIYLKEGFTPTYFVQFGRNQVATIVLASDYYGVMSEVEASFVNRFAMEHFDMYENAYGISTVPLSLWDGPDTEVDKVQRVGGSFSFDPLDGMGIGGSVIYQSLQLAFWFGFDPVLIVGLDHYYPVNVDEPWHFYPNKPETTDMNGPLGGREGWNERSVTAFENARMVYDDADREILNLTPDSACKVFRMEDMQLWV